MSANRFAIVFLLLLGVGCVWGADRVMYSRVESSLALRLVFGESGGERKLVAFLINMGDTPVHIPLDDLQFFVFVPDDGSTECTVHFQHTGRRVAGGLATAVIEPKKSLDVADAYPFLRNIPSAMKSVSAVYIPPKDIKAGVVRSTALRIERPGK